VKEDSVDPYNFIIREFNPPIKQMKEDKEIRKVNGNSTSKVPQYDSFFFFPLKKKLQC